MIYAIHHPSRRVYVNFYADTQRMVRKYRGAGIGNTDFDYSYQIAVRRKRSLSHKIRKSLRKVSLKLARMFNNLGMLDRRATEKYVAEHNRFIDVAKMDSRQVGSWYTMIDPSNGTISPSRTMPRSDSIDLDRDKILFKELLRDWQ